MTASKQVWILAGGNGAGKSTFYKLFLEPRGIKFVNSDRIAIDIDPQDPENAAYQAAEWAGRLRDSLLERGVSFCLETVFSHVSKIDFVAKAKSMGYEIILVYIHLEIPELNEARVRQRVTGGGHDVPREKIFSRIPRTMENISKILLLVDEARLLDNSSGKDPFRQIAVIRRGRCVKAVSPLPQWAEKMLAGII